MQNEANRIRWFAASGSMRKTKPSESALPQGNSAQARRLATQGTVPSRRLVHETAKV
jgi:hypothetical protein